eukprot:m.57698 g.57698  ORF g.57698 m.57698 type:complete len:68 (-) comp9368_c0_seq1:1354-1557(-)
MCMLPETANSFLPLLLLYFVVRVNTVFLCSSTLTTHSGKGRDSLLFSAAIISAKLYPTHWALTQQSA